MVPKELRCLETHEWARLEKDSGIITVGLSDYAVEQLGDIVFLELPGVGSKVVKGSEFCTIESVKAASDLYAPVSGEIAEVNESATENLELFKDDPYGQAWIVKIKAYDLAELETQITKDVRAEMLEQLTTNIYPYLAELALRGIDMSEELQRVFERNAQNHGTYT